MGKDGETREMDYIRTGDIVNGGASVTWTKGSQLPGSRIYAVAPGDTWQPETLCFDRLDPYWEMSLAHEWGHCLMQHFKPRLAEDVLNHRVGLYGFRFEVLAWRLAKSFLDPRLWDEEHALECLDTHWQKTFGFGKKLPAGLKIVPYQHRGQG